MIWTTRRKARKRHKCGYAGGWDLCPLRGGHIEAGEIYDESVASPFDEYAGSDIWDRIRLHAEHAGGTEGMEPGE